MTDVSGATTEALQNEINKRTKQESLIAAQTELAELQLFVDLGYGTEAIDLHISALQSAISGAVGKYYYQYLQAEIVGTEGMQSTVGNRIRFLGSQVETLTAEIAELPE